jgi:RNA polymerase sigma-70 factor (ECF subfamily)
VISATVSAMNELEQVEEHETKRLIRAFQAGDASAFNSLYARYFDQVFSYMQVALKDTHEAEDATQQVFLRTLQALKRFDVEGEAPFRAWLICVARNHVIDHLRKHNRLETTEPARIALHRERAGEAEQAIGWTLGWLSDDELLLLIERLPTVQRQVLAMRFMLSFTTAEIADALHHTPESVRQMQSRALRFLGDRLTSLGRKSLRVSDEPSLVLLRQAPVLRRRRFALGRGPAAARLA